MERVTFTDQEAPADDPQLENPAEEVNEQEEIQQTDRPEWLPDKFSDAEELAKAYSSLEKKFTSRQAEEKGLLTEDDFQNYANEYNENGGLTDETYDALAKKGLSKDLVDNYIRGVNQVNEAEVQDMYGIAGGEENYNAMTNWMAESLDQSELDAFNSAVEGDAGVARMAIKGMYAQFAAAGGESREPSLVQGGRPSSVGGYGSLYEMKEDMKDPRYQAGDRNFHAMVDKRLAMSGNLS